MNEPYFPIRYKNYDFAIPGGRKVVIRMEHPATLADWENLIKAIRQKIDYWQGNTPLTHQNP